VSNDVVDLIFHREKLSCRCIYGRPSSIDTGLVALHSLRDMDDLAIDPLLLKNDAGTAKECVE
jgi:hypothetical protein